MRLPKFILILFICLLSGSNLLGQKLKDSIYIYKKASADGIGKFYQGREIAQVMGFEGAAWLNRNTREQEENTKLAISKLPIKADDAVADIGAGTGYYTFQLAPKLTQGKIYAVEVQQSAVDYLRQTVRQKGFSNVMIIKGSPTSASLPDHTIDLAFMVDVYHELAYPHEMLQSIKRALKPDGKLLLIEYRAEDPAVDIKPLHKMSIAQVNKEMSVNGFKPVSSGDFLPIQHFLLYQKQ